MSDQDDFEQLKGSQDRRAERNARIRQRRTDRYAGGFGWIAGLVFIAIGAFYLLYETGILPNLDNWWALFFLLPAAATLSAAVGAYRREEGLWVPGVVIPFIAGLFFLGLTAAFLFENDG